MKRPHKWATEMHAFADGAVIEVLGISSSTWITDFNPNWGSTNSRFRIKPKVKLPLISTATLSSITPEQVEAYAYICYHAGYAAAKETL